MTSTLPGPARESLTGWGRCTRSSAQVSAVRSVDEVQAAVRAWEPRGVLARGAGRSYGDAAQNGGGRVLDLSAMSDLEVSAGGREVVAGAGLLLRDLLARLIPQGLTVPVSPGTSFVTVGGMVAADAHGKNHHAQGSFGSHVTWLEIVDGTGEPRRLEPHQAEFWATVGGMGLTGVITRVAFTPLAMPIPYLCVDVEPFDDLRELMATMTERDRTARYSVAWVDSVGLTGPVGRGILTTGEHAPAAARGSADASAALPVARGTRPALRAPRGIPGGLLNPRSVGAFNAAWFAREGRRRTGELQPFSRFFHPLDGVRDWNRIYGPAGFLQYQFAVPDAASEVIPQVLHALASAGIPSFLTVLKRFGPGNAGPLSFPAAGWTLAVDVPAAPSGLRTTLAMLDGVVVDAGGRFYLAKDAHTTASAFAAGYPRLSEWREVRRSLDPHGVFASDLSRRLGLIPAE